MKNIILTLLLSASTAFGGYFSLSASGGGITTTEPVFTATTAFRAADGSIAVPSYSYSSETGLGCYRSSAGTVRCASSATDRIQWSSVGFTVLNGGILRGGFGTAASIPGITFDGDGNTGLWRSAEDVMQVVSGGVSRMIFNASGGVSVESATASRACQFDASKNLTASATTSTELGFLSGVTSAVQTQIDSKVTGPASAVDNSILVADGTTGKLVKDPNVFVIDSAALELQCKSGSRCNSMMTSQTVLTAEETFRSITVNGNHYAQNSAGTRSARLGSSSSASSRVGPVWYDSSASKVAELTTNGAFLGANLDSFFPHLPPDFDSQANDLWLFTNKGAGASLGSLPSLGLLSNGSIWMFANGIGGNYPVMVFQDPTNTWGMAHSFHGGTMDIINATNLTAYGSPANGFSGYFKGGDYLTGTGNGGDMGLRGGNSTGGIGGHVPLTPGTGAVRNGVAYSEYGFAMTPGTASITADDQNVTVNNGVVVIDSDSTTATDRTFILNDGTRDGQVAQLIFNDATDAVELIDDDTQFCGSATWTPTDRDSLSIVWVSSISCWVETARSTN